MMRILSIAKRELRSFFVSPMAYAILVAWLLWCGANFGMLAEYYASSPSVGGSDTPLSSFFGGTVFFFVPLLVFVPVLTMRLIAAERTSGSLEALMTSPVRESELVLGKYLAAMVFFATLWVPTLLYVWITSRFGDIDLGTVAASYAGVMGIGAFYIAVGLLMSALAPNQVVAATMTFLVLGLLFAGGIMQYISEGPTRDVLSHLSIWTHMQDYSKGIVDSRTLVFDASVTALALFGATRALEWRRISGGPSGRGEALDEAATERSKGRFHSFIGLILSVWIVLMVNFLAFRHYERWDWTTESRYTLSDRTLQVVHGLDRDVEIVLLLSDGEEQFDDVRELLQRYASESTRLRIREVDPDRNPAEARRLAQRYDIRLQADGEGTTLAEVAALVISGERRWKVTRDDLIRVGMGESGDAQVDIQAERAVTGAIVEMVEGRTTKVCETTGHGEWSIGAGERSLTFLKAELERENTEVVPMSGAEVPSECDAVFVLGPQRAFRDEEAAGLVEYVQGGGHLLLALDPLVTREGVQPSGFEDALAQVGVRLDSAIVIEPDPRRTLSPDPTDRILFAVQPHAVTMPALTRGGPFLVSLAQSVRGEGEDVMPLFEGSADSFAKVDLSALLDADVEPGNGDIDGPANVGVARVFPSEDESEGRLLVFGDSDWMSDMLLSEPSFANVDIVMAATGWLTERDSLVAVPPRTSRMRAVVMSDADVSGVWRRVMVFLPGAMLLLGFAVWWSRRQ